MITGAGLDPGAVADALAARLPGPPEAVVVLGSGLSALADAVEGAVSIPFGELPGLPGVTVAGHGGRYVAGTLEGRRVLLQAGRLHLYEGHPPEVVCAPVRVAHRLGAPFLLLTNAAGGVHRLLEPGTLMLLDDHLNLTWRSPLAGPVRDGEARFPDMSRPYDPELQRLAVRAAAELGTPLARGVYAAVAGPSYETPAEVRMLHGMGADAVGMSTVPEVVVARALGMRCLGISLITNRAAGSHATPLSHDEVVAVGSAAGAALGRLIARIVRDLPGPQSRSGAPGGT